MNHVILSSDCNINYAFILPITVKAWARLGYRSILMLIGSEERWDKFAPHILGELQNSSSHIIFIPQLEGYSIWTTANIVRLYAGCLDLPDDDYAIVGDSDLWILKPDYLRHDPAKPVGLWFANAFAGKPELQYPMCHVGATLRAWRQIMGVEQGTDLRTTCQSQMDRDLGRGNDTDVFFNEKYWGKKLSQWPGYPNMCQFVDRHLAAPAFPSDRLDRSKWDLRRANACIDAHLPRDPVGNWHKIYPLVPMVLDEKDLAWAHAYRNRFTRPSGR